MRFGILIVFVFFLVSCDQISSKKEKVEKKAPKPSGPSPEDIREQKIKQKITAIKS